MSNPFFDVAMYASFVECLTEEQIKSLLVENYKRMLINQSQASDEVREDWGLI